MCTTNLNLVVHLHHLHHLDRRFYLRLGSAVCRAHTCPCGATMDPLGQRAPSCTKNARFYGRDWQEGNVVHSQSAGNHVVVPAYFSGDSAV